MRGPESLITIGTIYKTDTWAGETFWTVPDSWLPVSSVSLKSLKRHHPCLTMSDEEYAEEESV